MTPDHWDRWPYLETIAAAALLAIAIACSLSTWGCGGSGTHHVPKPGEMKVRTLVVKGPLGLRDYEIDYVKEAVEQYLVVVDTHRHPSKVKAGFYPIRIHVYRTAKAVNDARYSLPGSEVYTYNGTGFNTAEAPNGFVHGGELHVWGGSKWQIPGLAHMLWHIYEAYAPSDHSDLRLPNLNSSGTVVNNYLWAKR